MTIELKPDLKRKLAELAERTHRPAAALADMREGRLVPHDEAMDELDAAIELTARAK